MRGGRERASHREFKTTQWFVLASPSADRPSAKAAEYVCEHYWRPIYSHLRRRGFAGCDAQDLTQSFFFHIIKSGALARATPAKGRFRSFLLGALKHFLAKRAARGRAAKRGGGLREVELGPLPAAQSDAIAIDPREKHDLDERAQALALFEHVHGRLQAEYEAAGKRRMFEVLKTFCACDQQASGSYARISEVLGRPVATVRSDVARLRAGYRRLLREEVATRVEPRAVDEELSHVIALICDPP